MDDTQEPPIEPRRPDDHAASRELELHFRRSAYQADEDLVFGHPHSGRPYDASRMRKRFKEAVRRAGVRDVRFHDLRHTFGTQMAAAGAPLRAIQEWMGHRDYKTTSIYADYAPDPTGGRRWAERAFGDLTPAEFGALSFGDRMVVPTSQTAWSDEAGRMAQKGWCPNGHHPESALSDTADLRRGRGDAPMFEADD